MAEAFRKGKVITDLKRIFVIIPAAGLGTRMNSDTNKQFIEIDGVPVIERTLSIFNKFSEELLKSSNITVNIVVVTNEDFVFRIKKLCHYKNFDCVKSVIKGGDTRLESVWNGIEALDELPFPPSDEDVVFIHDGARCLVDQDILERCLEGAMKYDVLAAAVPVKSTIKQTIPEAKPAAEHAPVLGIKLPPILSTSNLFSNATKEPVVNEPEVKKTPDRNELMEVQTPQVFRYNKLLKSYVNAIKKNIEATDDTSLAEAMNYKVNLVEGSYSNIKITTPEDIAFAEGILKRQRVEDSL